MMDSQLWAASMLMLPLIAAILIFIFGRYSERVLVPLTIIAMSISLWNLFLQVWTNGMQSYPIANWDTPLGVELYVDGLSIAMLIMTFIISVCVSVYAFKYFACFEEQTNWSIKTPDRNTKALSQTKTEHVALPSSYKEEKENQLVVVEENDYLPSNDVEEAVTVTTKRNPRAFPKGQANFLFWPLWLLLWGGLNALFLSSNLFSFYVTLEILTLASVPMIVLSNTVLALNAAMRYLFIAVFASIVYLLAIVFLYGVVGSLDIQSLALELRSGATIWMAISLILIALTIKSGVIPFWLVSTISNAPIPVAILLVALVIKAAFYILLRVWFEVLPNEILGLVSQLVGLIAAVIIIWASWQALQQRRLIRLLAYATVAQAAYLLLIFPLANGITDAWSFDAWQAGIYLSISHAFVLAALFMVAGHILYIVNSDFIHAMQGVGRISPLTLITFSIAGLCLIGLPSILVDAIWQSGQWWWLIVIIIGMLLTASYIFKVLILLFTKLDDPVKHEGSLALSMILIPLLLSIIVLSMGFFDGEISRVLAMESPFGAVNRN
jgi:multicomponent Na+:H+ antiporter subunit D